MGLLSSKSGTHWSTNLLSNLLVFGYVNCELNHGCSKSSCAVSLSDGSFLSIDRNKHFAFDEIQSGNTKCPLRIFENSADGSLS